MRWKIGLGLSVVLGLFLVIYTINTEPAIAPPGLEAEPEDLILELGFEGPLFFEPAAESENVESVETAPLETAPIKTATIKTAQSNSLSTAQLIQQLGDEATLDAACSQLVSRGEEVIGDLKAALQNDNWRIRAGVVFALSQLGGDAEASLPALQEVANSDDQEAVRSAARFAIDAIGKR